MFGCNAQNKKPAENKQTMNLAFISNEKIKYSIVLMACDTCVPIRNIGYRVIVSLSKKEENIVKKITPDTWKALLNNNKSDWASNLILYNLHNKDAFRLSKHDDREVWFKHFKKEDLEFWDNQFKK